MKLRTILSEINISQIFKMIRKWFAPHRISLKYDDYDRIIIIKIDKDTISKIDNLEEITNNLKKYNFFDVESNIEWSYFHPNYAFLEIPLK